MTASLEQDELERRVAERTAELRAANAATEQALRQSEARFRALIENSFDITSITDGEGRISYISPSVERILGYAPQELEGSFFEFIHPDDLAALRETFERATSQPGQVQLNEFRALHKDGTWRVMDAVGLNQLDDPAVRGMVFNVRDVTSRRALETRLHQSERLDAIGQLAGGVAHDFNNILLVIRGYSSVLRATLENAEHIADVDEIASAADRAAELTRHLLAFGRRQVLQPHLVSVADTVRGLESLLRHSIRANVDLSLDLAAGLPAVLADPAQVEQVILNLVVNARDAMAPAGGVVELSVGCAELTGAEEGISPPLARGSYVVLSVVDTGCGISDDVLPHIFEPFFTTKEDGVGTGLGLSTVYGIVVQSGGGIDVRSHAGRGTTVTVYLPVATVGRDDEPSIADAVSSPPRGTETIVLVEDEAAVRELVRRVLEDAGYRVLPAEKPSEAEQLLAEAEHVDLLLTDVVMPEMSGYDLAVRALEHRPELRTMFMSGYSHPAAGSPHVEGLLLQKPFTTDELARAVRKELDK